MNIKLFLELAVFFLAFIGFGCLLAINVINGQSMESAIAEGLFISAFVSFLLVENRIKD